MSVNPIPKGYHTITPYLVVEDADKQIEFMQAAFGATVREAVRNKEGQVMHGEVKIGDSVVMVGRKQDAEQSATMLYVYVENTDDVYQQALTAGAVSLMEPKDQFYGDRNAGVADPFGNKWWIATHVEDLTSEELEQRAQDFHANA